jgi:hypothetical protein
MITVGNRSKIKTEKISKLRICIVQYDERKFKITLENVKLVPDLWVNLFRINKALMNGLIIGNESALIKLTKGEIKLFSIKV